MLLLKAVRSVSEMKTRKESARTVQEMERIVHRQSPQLAADLYEMYNVRMILSGVLLWAADI